MNERVRVDFARAQVARIYDSEFLVGRVGRSSGLRALTPAHGYVLPSPSCPRADAQGDKY